MTQLTTTTKGTTTPAEFTTTTATEVVIPTFLADPEFYDSSDTAKPWERFSSTPICLSLDSKTKHDGGNSVRLDLTAGWQTISDSSSQESTR